MHENGIKISALSFAVACALAFVADAAGKRDLLLVAERASRGLR